MTTIPDMVVRDVPVVIEPGIEVVEASVFVSDSSAGSRSFPVQLFRVALDGKILKRLPFVPSTTLPHVFSPLTDIKESTLLVLYDHLGRLTTIYKRLDKHSWSRYDVADEHAGKSVVVPSVRFQFKDVNARTRFLTLTDQILRQAREDIIDCDAIQEFTTLLSRMRTPPVSLPVAVLKPFKVPCCDEKDNC